MNATTSKQRYEAAVKEYWEWHHRLSVADGNGSSPALVSKLQKELCDAQERRNQAFKEYVEDRMEETL